MISVEHMDELIQRFNSGELDIRDIIEQSYLAGEVDATNEWIDIIDKGLPSFREKLLSKLKENENANNT